MRLNSIITKISLIFFIALILLSILFVFFIKNDRKVINRQVIHNHKNLSLSLFRQKLPRAELIEFMDDLNYELTKKNRKLLAKGKVVFSKRGLETIVYKKKIYLYVKTPYFRLLFKDLNVYEKSYIPFYIFSLVLILLVFIYLWLIRSLKPLTQLKESITKFGQGDLTIRCNSDKKDEIADVANEFDSAVSKINLLLNSRQLFLRTIMHELKTPIAKGRIISELIKDEKQKNRMSIIFEKLDFLINDFAKVEQVVSQNYELNTQGYSIKTVLEYSQNMLMLEQDSEKILLDIYDDFKFDVDLELMAMVFKNLIDNALKYSIDSKVIIEVKENYIIFISKGSALQKPLTDYFEAFHNDTSYANHGMGLGLYIVNSILKLHDFKLEYKHEKEINEFKIIF